MLRIKSLRSGGIITNYFCSSRCRHCLYACSPNWDKDYIQEDQLTTNLKIIKKLGCDSIHIGGGEPFLNKNKLIDTIKTIVKNNLSIEYIETNSSWFSENDENIDYLRQIRDEGVSTLLISISPFHNEFIPFKKVKSILRAMNSVGLYAFLWTEKFYTDLNSFPDTEKISIEQYFKKFGDTYLQYILSRYWIHLGGRVLDTYKNQLPLKPVETILKESTPCIELADTTHFHVDLFGNFIPGLCSGIAIEAVDILDELSSEKYPLISELFKNGVGGLYKYASENLNITIRGNFLNKCHLCTAIRKEIVQSKLQFNELKPTYFYSELNSDK